MNQTYPMPASREDTAKSPVCRTVPLRCVPGAERRELAFCAIPEQDSQE